MIEQRIVGTGNPKVQEVAVRDVVNSRGAEFAFTNPMPTVMSCSANTKAGVACKAPPIRGESWCIAHKRA